MRNPHAVTADFERALCEYTGAKYAVAVNSCSMALLLAVAYATKVHRSGKLRHGKHLLSPHCNGKVIVDIPKRTYVSVPQSIIHAGCHPSFRDENWQGAYELIPLNVWDSARRFTSGMYIAGQIQCVSFHASKILGLEQGGAILLDDPQAAEWLRRARFDGRTQGVAPIDDTFNMIGWHCYINPSTAAQGLLKLHSLPQHNSDLPNDPYPDLSQLEIFK